MEITTWSEFVSYFRIHIDRKNAGIERSPSDPTPWVVSIDAGYNWRWKDDILRPGDVVLLQNRYNIEALSEGQDYYRI